MVLAKTNTEPTLTGYAAARAGTAYRIIQQAGMVRVGGETRLDYVQRQSSNDVMALRPEIALPNILTAPTGRILDIFTMLADADSYLLLTPEGRGASLADYFQRRIFFNDQVTVKDESAEWVQVEVLGPGAEKVLAALGLGEAPAMNAVMEGRVGSEPLRVIGQRGPTQPTSYLVLANAGMREALQAALEASGAEALSVASAEALRVEAGLPGAGELGGDFTPFEVGLAERVSGSKGCYTGQEVLARQVTYDKVTRQLAQVALDGAVEVGADVLAGDKLAGKVNSVATSPHAGELALAVLRKPAHEPGTRLVIRSEAGEVSGKVQAPD